MSHYPLFDPEFLDALQNRIVESWVGTAWRITISSALPLTPSTRGARWNPPGVEALYASLDRDAAIAEVEYLLSNQPRIVRKPRIALELKVRLSSVIDLSTADSMAAFGWTRDHLTNENLTLPQKIGAAAEFLEVGGLFVPSARSMATNVVMLTKYHKTADVVEIISSEELDGPVL